MRDFDESVGVGIITLSHVQGEKKRGRGAGNEERLKKSVSFQTNKKGYKLAKHGLASY